MNSALAHTGSQSSFHIWCKCTRDTNHSFDCSSSGADYSSNLWAFEIISNFCETNNKTIDTDDRKSLNVGPAEFRNERLASAGSYKTSVFIKTRSKTHQHCNSSDFYLITCFLKWKLSSLRDVVLSSCKCRVIQGTDGTWMTLDKKEIKLNVKDSIQLCSVSRLSFSLPGRAL